MNLAQNDVPPMQVQPVMLSMPYPPFPMQQIHDSGNMEFLVETFKKRIQELEAAAAVSERMLAIAQERIETLNRFNGEMLKENLRLRAAGFSYKEDLDKEVRRSAEKEMEMCNAKSKTGQARASKQPTVSDSLGPQIMSLERVREFVISVTKEANSLNSDGVEMRRAITHMFNCLSEKMNIIDRTTKEKLAECKKAYQTMRDQNKKEVEKLRSKVKNLEAKLSESETKCAAADETLKTRNEQVLKLEASLLASNKTNKSHDETIRKLQSNKQKLINENSAFQARIETLKTKLNDSAEYAESLEEQLVTSNDRYVKREEALKEECDKKINVLMKEKQVLYHDFQLMISDMQRRGTTGDVVDSAMDCPFKLMPVSAECMEVLELLKGTTDNYPIPRPEQSGRQLAEFVSKASEYLKRYTGTSPFLESQNGVVKANDTDEFIFKGNIKFMVSDLLRMLARIMTSTHDALHELVVAVYLSYNKVELFSEELQKLMMYDLDEATLNVSDEPYKFEHVWIETKTRITKLFHKDESILNLIVLMGDKFIPICQSIFQSMAPIFATANRKSKEKFVKELTETALRGTFPSFKSAMDSMKKDHGDRLSSHMIPHVKESLAEAAATVAAMDALDFLKSAEASQKKSVKAVKSMKAGKAGQAGRP